MKHPRSAQGASSFLRPLTLRVGLMFFFVVGNSRETLAASIVISITFWCISTASQRWTFDPAGTVAVVLGLAVPALLLLVRSVVTRSLLSHVASALSRSFFGARGNLRAGVAAQPIDVLPRLQALPIEHWRPAASLSVSELRRRLMQRGGVAEPRALLERSELERAYADVTERCCAICHEDYEDGDACRLLWPRCRHAYHVECFDRWALSLGAKGRHPTCPVCQAPI